MWTISGFADEIDPDLDIQIETLVSLGISHIEVRSAWGVNVLDLSDDQLAEVSRRLTTAGLRVSSIGSPIGKVPVASNDDDHVARFRRALEVAERLNSPFIRIFSFWMPAGAYPAASRDLVLSRLAGLVELCRGRDVVLVHENEKEIYGDVPDRVLDLVESLGSEQFKLAWDPANFVQCGVRPFTDGYARLREYLAYVQIKDALLRSGEVVPAGKGDGQLPETLRALHADGFEGFFSLEPHLKEQSAFGGHSGAELFCVAHGAFVGLLHDAGIPFQ